MQWDRPNRAQDRAKSRERSLPKEMRREEKNLYINKLFFTCSKCLTRESLCVPFSPFFSEAARSAARIRWI